MFFCAHLNEIERFLISNTELCLMVRSKIVNKFFGNNIFAIFNVETCWKYEWQQIVENHQYRSDENTAEEILLHSFVPKEMNRRKRKLKMHWRLYRANSNIRRNLNALVLLQSIRFYERINIKFLSSRKTWVQCHIIYFSSIYAGIKNKLLH